MKLLDVVALIEDVPTANLLKGQVGTIVEELSDEVVLVEFADMNGVAYAIAPLAIGKLMELRYTPAMVA